MCSEDKLGYINKEQLDQILKEEFGLSINLEEFLKEIDINGDGKIEFTELRNLLNI